MDKERKMSKPKTLKRLSKGEMMKNITGWWTIQEK